MTATYWEIGCRIVEYEQQGRKRAEYGQALLARLSSDLTRHCGRGFSVDNLERFRSFYLAWPQARISATPLRKSRAGRNRLVPSGHHKEATGARSHGKAESLHLAKRFRLPWSAYARLLTVKNRHARSFYEMEALRGGWSVRQLDRQIQSQFYERTVLSRNKAAVLRKGMRALRGDAVTAEEGIKDPYVLEFLSLRDEYSESNLEQALTGHLELFLLELGGDFCFVARQRRLRIGDEWYRVDLVFYHRRLRCLVLVDLKLGRFTHGDAGQMHMYLNYGAEHWTGPDENPPVGLILCARKNDALAHYALSNLPTKVLAAEYRTILPDEETIAAEMEETRRALEHGAIAGRG